MEVTAFAKNVRISPQKVKLVVDQIKKLKPNEALTMLDFIPQKGAKAIRKVVVSAIANARNNFGLDLDSLILKQIIVSKGITFRRYQPIARGRAHPILKRTSHIKVILAGQPPKRRLPKRALLMTNKNLEGRPYGSKG